jgi:hypothetical protein
MFILRRCNHYIRNVRSKNLAKVTAGRLGVITIISETARVSASVTFKYFHPLVFYIFLFYKKFYHLEFRG